MEINEVTESTEANGRDLKFKNSLITHDDPNRLSDNERECSMGYIASSIERRPRRRNPSGTSI